MGWFFFTPVAFPECFTWKQSTPLRVSRFQQTCCSVNCLDCFYCSSNLIVLVVNIPANSKYLATSARFCTTLELCLQAWSLCSVKCSSMTTYNLLVRCVSQASQIWRIDLFLRNASRLTVLRTGHLSVAASITHWLLTALVSWRGCF